MTTTQKTYTTALRILALGAVAFFAVLALTHGSTEDVAWGKQGTADGTSWAEQLAAKHDCRPTVEGHLPSAVIVTRDGDVAAKYLTTDKAIGAALDHEFGTPAQVRASGVVSVSAFCR